MATLLINVAIDATGAIPTLIKSYYEPETEDFTAWLIFFIANTLQLIAIQDWNLCCHLSYLFILPRRLYCFISYKRQTS